MKRKYNKYNVGYIYPEMATDSQYGPAAEEEFPSNRVKKVRKKKHYFLRFLLFVAIVVGLYYLLTSDLFEIREIEVMDNKHFNTQEVVKLSGIKTGTNMFKLKSTEIEEKLEKNAYIKSADIVRKPMHKLEIKVEERSEDFCVLSNEKYIVMDYDGVVLYISEEAPTMTVVKNMEVTDAKLGQELAVKNSYILTDTISFLKKVDESELFFKDIETTDLGVKAYMNEIFLCKGSFKDMEENIGNIKRVIHDLGKEKIGRGSIIVSGNGTFTFTPEI